MNSAHCVLTGIVLLILLSTTFTTAATSDRLDIIHDQGCLLIAGEPYGAPYISLVPGEERNPVTNCTGDCYTENQVTGFDVATTSYMARKLGVEPGYVKPDHSQVRSEDWSGWDVLTTYYITNDRLKDYYFTRPTVSESSRFFIRSNETEITEPANLSGKTIGVGNATAQLQYLKNELSLPGVINENLVIDPVISEYMDENDALDALITGEVDAVLLSESTGNDAIANGTPLTALEPAAFTGYAGLTLSKSSEGDASSLIQNLNTIIEEMHADGELSNISQTYLGKDITRDAASFDYSILNQSFE